MQWIAIILFSVGAAIAYGIVHDQITARICVEYFTIGHPRLIDTDSPTILGLFWGVVATWWVGLPLGFGLAFAARVGRRPKLCVRHLIRPMLTLLVCMLGIATIAGVVGYVTAKTGVVRLLEPLASQVPERKHTAFLIDGWAHSASYLTGMIGGITLSIMTWRRRGSQVIVGEQARCSEPGDGALVETRRPVAPGH